MRPAKRGPRGTLVLTGTTGGGKLAVTGRAAKALRVFKATRTLAPGAFRITLKPSRRAARVIRLRKKLKVKLAITFSPATGTPATASRTVTLKQRR